MAQDPKQGRPFGNRNARKHGMFGTPIYHAWAAMKKRCSNPNDPAYKDYGGRGILVCERWQRFENFYADMGDRPSSSHSLERIENNGNYETGNVRWATRSEQANNTRANHVIEALGERLTLIQWARRIGATPETIKGRIKRGWSIDRAVTLPPQQEGRRAS